MSGAHDTPVRGLLHEQLPVVMAQDPNLVKFVALVDETASELYERVGQKDLVIDPATAPEPMIDWLAGLIGLRLERDLPLDLRRCVVTRAAEWYPRRGTVESLRQVIAALVGGPRRADGETDAGDAGADRSPMVTIEEPGWIRCRPDPEEPPTDREPPGPPPLSSIPTPPVRFVVRPAVRVSRADICALIERELRADVPYTVELATDAPEEATT